MPLEIRYMIYSYLTPDDIIPSSFYTPSRSLRKDNEKCASALFVVNRMIHKEFSEAWYENDYAIYQIFIGKEEMRFLDHTYDASTTVVLPQSLRRIKSLRITLQGIPLIGEYDPFTEEKAESYRTNHLSGSLKLIKAVTDMLQPGKCALRNLKINILGTTQFCLKSWCRRGPGRSQQALNLSTFLFKDMRGQLQSIDATFLPPSKNILRAAWSQERKDEWGEEMRLLLDKFEQEMLFPCTSSKSMI